MKSKKKTILGLAAAVTIAISVPAIYLTKKEFPDYISLATQNQDIVSVQYGNNEFNITADMAEQINSIRDIQSFFEDETILQRYIIAILYEETQRGNQTIFFGRNPRLIIDYILAINGIGSTTGAFELSIDNYAQGEGISRQQAIQELQEFSNSLRGLITKIQEDFSYLTRAGVDITQMSDMERVFYLALSHNAGFTRNFGLKVQLITNSLAQKTRNFSPTPLRYDGIIGNNTKTFLVRLLNRVAENNQENRTQILALAQQVNNLENRFYLQIVSNPAIDFLIHHYDNNNWYVTNDEILYLIHSQNSSPQVNYAARVVSHLFF